MRREVNTAHDIITIGEYLDEDKTVYQERDNNWAKAVQAHGEP